VVPYKVPNPSSILQSKSGSLMSLKDTNGGRTLDTVVKRQWSLLVFTSASTPPSSSPETSLLLELHRTLKKVSFWLA